ncbi:MAG TPA: 3-oxoacyl-[acyl-carrier-protein] reductase [Spirochaetota bacterium]|nr:3-oxoacyl-[acyl-carrier-protein] reductase [Spirochaetota bacterium]
MNRLNGKTAVITGSARGIGKEIARKYKENGAKIVISDIDEEMARATAAELGGGTIALSCNVTNKDDVAKLINDSKAEFGSVDIVVNNAGITKDGLFIRMKEADWDSVLSINLKGTFLTSQAAAQVMMKQRSGKIVNIASVSGLFGNAGQANYASSKAGIVGLTKVMARELAGRGINVNAIAPGFIESDMTDKLSEKVKTAIKEQIPFKKMGSVNDIANTALFLASDESSYITGQTIAVCGGLTMQS